MRPVSHPSEAVDGCAQRVIAVLVLALTGSHTIVLGLYAAAFLTSGVVFALAARRRR